MSRLYSVSKGPADGTPIILLHGFGGSHRAWDAVIPALEAAHRVIAFDMPGHGGSLDFPINGGAGDMANVVLNELADIVDGPVHFAGHSMGGATAAICALKAPERCASLTLLAPGSFGWEVNHRLLRRFASASSEVDITLLLEQFFGWQNPLPDGLAGEMALERKRNRAINNLETIVDALLDGSTQKVLPITDIAALDIPVKVIWGTQDRVLPTRQAHKLPGRIAVHIFEEVGHMVPMEIPDDVAHLILENTR